MAAKTDTTPMIMKQGRFVPWLYLLPALVLMTAFIIYPGINTMYLSLRNNDSTAWASVNCVAGEPCWGIFENYRYALTSNVMLTAFLNNLKWILLMVSGTVLFGLLTATLADKVRYEPLAKAIIFLPMAISFVGAGVIWKFVYDFSSGGPAPNRFPERHRSWPSAGSLFHGSPNHRSIPTCLLSWASGCGPVSA